MLEMIYKEAFNESLGTKGASVYDVVVNHYYDMTKEELKDALSELLFAVYQSGMNETILSIYKDLLKERLED